MFNSGTRMDNFHKHLHSERGRMGGMWLSLEKHCAGPQLWGGGGRVFSGSNSDSVVIEKLLHPQFSLALGKYTYLSKVGIEETGPL